MLNPIAKKVIEAYGGADRWGNARFIEAEVSARGLAFTLKQRPVFDHASIKMEIHQPVSRLTPIGRRQAISGILDGKNVRLEDPDGAIVAERKHARTYFPLGRRLFYWDDLDMAYFANYAFWNYFTLPALLMNSEITWTERSSYVLEAVFPDSIPTHCKKQTFRFDPNSSLLVQHNYTAEVIGKLAIAANVVVAHSETNGLKYSSLRSITPASGKGTALKWPVLIEIEVHNFKLTED